MKKWELTCEAYILLLSRPNSITKSMVKINPLSIRWPKFVDVTTEIFLVTTWLAMVCFQLLILWWSKTLCCQFCGNKYFFGCCMIGDKFFLIVASLVTKNFWLLILVAKLVVTKTFLLLHVLWQLKWA